MKWFKKLKERIKWFPHNPDHFKVRASDVVDIAVTLNRHSVGEPMNLEKSTYFSCEEPWESTLTLEKIKEAYELIKPTIERREKLIKEILKHPLGQMHLEMMGIHIPMELPDIYIPEIELKPYKPIYSMVPMFVNTPIHFDGV